MRTLSFLSSHSKTPPRLEICFAVSLVLPNFSAQKGVNVVWAEPVTGSSFTPQFGPKNLDTKSKFSEIEHTIIPLALIFAISGMLGSIFWIWC